MLLDPRVLLIRRGPAIPRGTLLKPMQFSIRMFVKSPGWPLVSGMLPMTELRRFIMGDVVNNKAGVCLRCIAVSRTYFYSTVPSTLEADIRLESSSWEFSEHKAETDDKVMTGARYRAPAN
jgi:hypothetical protein